MIFHSSSQPYQEQNMKPFLSERFDLTFITPFLDGISFVYHQEEVSVATLGAAGFIEFFIRKGAHVTVFMILAVLFYYAFTKTTAFKRSLSVTLAWVCTVLYAITDEWHQGLTPNRTPYAGDVVLDAVGASFAVIAIVLLSTIRRQRR